MYEKDEDEDIFRDWVLGYMFCATREESLIWGEQVSLPIATTSKESRLLLETKIICNWKRLYWKLEDLNCGLKKLETDEYGKEVSTNKTWLVT